MPDLSSHRRIKWLEYKKGRRGNKICLLYTLTILVSSFNYILYPLTFIWSSHKKVLGTKKSFQLWIFAYFGTKKLWFLYNINTICQNFHTFIDLYNLLHARTSNDFSSSSKLFHIYESVPRSRNDSKHRNIFLKQRTLLRK